MTPEDVVNAICVELSNGMDRRDDRLIPVLQQIGAELKRMNDMEQNRLALEANPSHWLDRRGRA